MVLVSYLIDLLEDIYEDLGKSLMFMYRVAHLVANLGWVDLNFDFFTLCLILPGLMGIWQKRLGSWARWWNSQIHVNRTQVQDQMDHPVFWPEKTA